MPRTHRAFFAPALALLALLALMVAPAGAQVSITANITGTAPSDQANPAIQNALNFLASDFTSATPFSMTANISWDSTLSGTGTAGTSAAGSGDFQNHNGVLYVNPLDRFVFGAASQVNTSAPGYADFSIALDPGTKWDYTLGQPADFSAYSLADVIYHESLHSMGFTAFNSSDGSYQFGAPTVFTTKMFDATTNQAFSADTQVQRQAAIVNGEAPNTPGALLFTGATAQAVLNGNPVRLYAPAVYSDGSSDGSHISPLQQGAGLLYPSLGNGSYLTPTNLELAMMDDIGWNAPISLGDLTPPTPSVPEPSSLATLCVGLAVLVLLRRARLSREPGAF